MFSKVADHSKPEISVFYEQKSWRRKIVRKLYEKRSSFVTPNMRGLGVFMDLEIRRTLFLHLSIKDVDRANSANIYFLKMAGRRGRQVKMVLPDSGSGIEWKF
jgi:hypothetical protein